METVVEKSALPLELVVEVRILAIRRNWDSYLVDGEVKKLSYVEARKMQGFPDDFEFPVSPTQAIKQLGNSVAIDAVSEVGKNIIAYMSSLNSSSSNSVEMKKTKNKGEWSELLAFIRILHEQKILLSDKNLKPTGDYFQVNKITGNNINLDFLLTAKDRIEIVNRDTGVRNEIEVEELINSDVLRNLVEQIKLGKGTFIIPDFEVIQNALGLTVVKGGSSSQKADIILDIQNNIVSKINEGFGIKSFLGSKPTLLNASGNTNFKFEVKNLSWDKVDEINAIDTRTKLTDRLRAIEQYGGVLYYIAPEKKTMLYNLKMVDSQMPKIIGSILLTFYKQRISSVAEIIDYVHHHTDLIEQIQYEDKNWLISKVKQMLVDILLGFFAGSQWNGTYEAHGTIVIKKTGEQVAFHIIDIESLKTYLWENIKLDTPSTTRHRYGKLIMESNNKLYFKLNLQLRF